MINTKYTKFYYQTINTPSVMTEVNIIPLSKRAARAKSNPVEKLNPHRWSNCLNIQWNTSSRYSNKSLCMFWSEKRKVVYIISIIYGW